MKTILIVGCCVALFSSSAVFAQTSWERCRQLGLTSALDCKRYDEEPEFRAKVRQALEMSSPSREPYPVIDDGRRRTTPAEEFRPRIPECASDRDFNCVRR